MARLIIGARPLDMTAWDLSDLAGGAVTADTASEVDVTGAGGVYHYKITGTGFTTFDGNGFPTDGTVTGFERVVPGKSPLMLSDISVAATTFMGWVNTNNGTAMVNALFAGDDTIVGRSGDDVLLGLGGNDHINLSRGGNDNVDAGAGNDNFTMLDAFNAGDHINGGAGSDKLVLDGDYSGGVVFTATTLTNVELIHATAGFDYNLTLSAASDTAGQTLTVLGSDLMSPNVLTIDGSAVAGVLVVTGGAGGDVLSGGALNNTLRGADGDDILTGGTGTNALTGGAGNDTLYAGTGNNTLKGGDGDDLYVFTNWNTHDLATDGGGTDTLRLNGDFSAGVTLSGTQIAGIETLTFAAGHSYHVTANNTFGIATIDGSALGAADSLYFNGGASQQKTAYNIIGGAGNDTLIGNGYSPPHGGGSTGDTFDLTRGGNDTVSGGFAIDTFNFGGTFTAADSVNGGGGVDTVNLVGDYSAPLNLGTSLNHINILNITSPSVDLTLGTNNVTSWSPNAFVIHINASTVHVDTSAGRGSFPEISIDTPASGTLTGGDTNDDWLVQASSPDLTVNCNGGADNVGVVGQAGVVADTSGLHIDGGAGSNLFEVETGIFTITPSIFTNFSTLEISGATAIMTDADVSAGTVLTVFDEDSDDAFDGSAETDGSFNVLLASTATAIGGAGNDTFSGVDVFGNPEGIATGGLGADTLNSILVANYTGVADSTSVHYDTIEQMNFASSQTFHGLGTPTHFDTAITSGTLSTATFDADLAAAVSSAHLGAGHAVLFTPNAGSLSGHTFLIVDANGVAGYQASQDYVLDLVNCSGTLHASNFT